MSNKTSSGYIEWQVEGMTCNNCANNIKRYLENEGIDEAQVNFASGEVRFNQDGTSLDKLQKGIESLGYKVNIDSSASQPWWTLERKLIFASIFTLPLFLQHIFHVIGLHPIPALANSWVQLVICLPVFIIGFIHFGKTSWKSLRMGMAHMDVLIFIGSTAAFIYSLIGSFLGEPDYIFYETSATIITLVLLGNWMEKRSVRQTTTAIEELSRLKPEKAKKIMPSGAVVQLETDEIQLGDHLQVNKGDKIPLDGKIISGSGQVDESMLTGESLPVRKNKADRVIGASLVVEGNFQIEVIATGKATVLNQIIELVKTAQQEKPPIQRLADRISGVFVPAVILIALGTFLVSHFLVGISLQQALMNSIAVLVISCPCAMGLATPTAVMVGVGRAAREGILIRGGNTLEKLSHVKQIIFDKTGTLTKGEFRIAEFKNFSDLPEADLKKYIYELEKRSSHPIASSLVKLLEDDISLNGDPIFDSVSELSGKGVKGITPEGNEIVFGSEALAREVMDTPPVEFKLFLIQGKELLAAINIDDTPKPEVGAAIEYLRKHQIEPIILSGDKEINVAVLASKLGIARFYSEKLPDEKLSIVEELSDQKPTAMVGDGINDAPALVKSDLGISLSNASQIAIQSAQVILLNGNLEYLIKALGIGRQTYLTIKQNLFWAFAYNIVAIPIAAMGYLNPMWGALFMAFSDVVVIGNSIRLKHKNIEG